MARLTLEALRRLLLGGAIVQEPVVLAAGSPACTRSTRRSPSQPPPRAGALPRTSSSSDRVARLNARIARASSSRGPDGRPLARSPMSRAGKAGGRVKAEVAVGLELTRAMERQQPRRPTWPRLPVRPGDAAACRPPSTVSHEPWTANTRAAASPAPPDCWIRREPAVPDAARGDRPRPALAPRRASRACYRLPSFARNAGRLGPR